MRKMGLFFAPTRFNRILTAIFGQKIASVAAAGHELSARPKPGRSYKRGERVFIEPRLGKPSFLFFAFDLPPANE
jgi:hypothetical protein